MPTLAEIAHRARPKRSLAKVAEAVENLRRSVSNHRASIECGWKDAPKIQAIADPVITKRYVSELESLQTFTMDLLAGDTGEIHTKKTGGRDGGSTTTVTKGRDPIRTKLIQEARALATAKARVLGADVDGRLARIEAERKGDEVAGNGLRKHTGMFLSMEEVSDVMKAEIAAEIAADIAAREAAANAIRNGDRDAAADSRDAPTAQAKPD